MTMHSRTKYPLKYFLLDSVGAVFGFISLCKLAGDIDIVPTFLQFENYGWYSLLISIIFVLPGILCTIKKALKDRSLRDNT